jgi:hypothetical protein
MKSSIFWDITPCSPQSSAFHLLSRWFHAGLILLPWRWRWYVPPKRRLTFNGLHGVISQKILLFFEAVILVIVNIANSGTCDLFSAISRWFWGNSFLTAFSFSLNSQFERVLCGKTTIRSYICTSLLPSILPQTVKQILRNSPSTSFLWVRHFRDGSVVQARRLDAGFSPRSIGVNPAWLHARFLKDEVALTHDYLIVSLVLYW